MRGSDRDPLHFPPYSHPGSRSALTPLHRPRKCPQTHSRKEVLPASFLGLSIKPRPHSGGRWRPRSQALPTHSRSPRPSPRPPTAPAPLTGRRARRRPPHSRCLGPGSCHRGLPGPAVPRQRRGSGLGGTKQGPGCPARPPARCLRGPAHRQPRPWPAPGLAPPAPTAPRHTLGAQGAEAGAGPGPRA